MSRSVFGLQSLIDTSVNVIKHVTNHYKTNCMIFGGNPFVVKPKHYIQKNVLSIANNIDNLGVTLRDNSAKCAKNKKIQPAEKHLFTSEHRS